MMKTLLRNFLSVLRRFQMAVGLNVIGLSVAFTAFLVIMMQVSHDHSFDRCHLKAGRIFLAELRRADRLLSPYRGRDDDHPV